MNFSSVSSRKNILILWEIIELKQTWKYTFSLLKRYLAPYKMRLFSLAILIIAYYLINIFNPQIVRFYINTVTSDTLNYRNLVIAGAIYSGMGWQLLPLLMDNKDKG